MVIQPHLPDRHGAHVEPCTLLGKESARDFRKLFRHHSQVMQIGSIKKDA